MPTVSEKTHDRKNEKISPEKPTEFESPISAALQIAEHIQSSLTNVNVAAWVQPFQASIQAIETCMSHQAEMFAELAKVANSVTIDPSLFTHLSDLNSLAAVDVSRRTPIISQPIENVDVKLLWDRISFLQKENSAKD